MSQSYTYSISSDTLNGIVNSSLLQQEIQNSTDITYSLDYSVGINTQGDVLTITFLEAIGDQTADLDNIVSIHIGEATITPEQVIVSNINTDGHGSAMFSQQPRSGSGLTVITHNFSDAHSWLHTSEAVAGASTSSGDNTTYVISGSDTMIDIQNGRVTREDDFEIDFNSQSPTFLQPVYTIDRKYIPVIYRNSSEVDDSEYTIDYENRNIVFNSAQDGGDVITVDYYKMVNSKFSITPNENKSIIIEHVEIQFSDDIAIRKRWLYFDTLVYSSQAGDYILARRTIYKNRNDLMNESNNNKFKVVPTGDGSTKDAHIYTWKYPTSKDVDSSLGLKIEIYLLDPTDGSMDKPYLDELDQPTELSTGTFYSLSESIT